MADYSSLQSQIATELARADLTTPIQNAVLAAIRHYQRHIFLFSEASGSISAVASTATYDLPTDFLAFSRLEKTVNGTTTALTYLDYNELANRDTAGHEGEPANYAYRDGDVRLYPVPDGSYTLALYYWAADAAPSAGGDSTVWTNDALDLIRHRAKWEIALSLLQDDAQAARFKQAEIDVFGAMLVQRDRLVASRPVTPTLF